MKALALIALCATIITLVHNVNGEKILQTFKCDETCQYHRKVERTEKKAELRERELKSKKRLKYMQDGKLTLWERITSQYSDGDRDQLDELFECAEWFDDCYERS